MGPLDSNMADQKLLLSLLLSVGACAAVAPRPNSRVLRANTQADPCCITCPEGEPKYYSIDKGGDCGEACIPDSEYPVLKMFEPGLLKADPTSEADDFGMEVCAAKGLPVYTRTVSHGAGPLRVTLDLYTSEE